MAPQGTAVRHHGGVVQQRPEDIIGEWGIRDVSPPSQAERKRLEAEQDLNPLVGRPLPRRIRRFRVEADRFLASLGGPLPYMQRLKRIDDEIDRQSALLAEAYAEYGADPAAWRGIVERWNFSEVNDLIERHNRWYPVEASLPMDPRTRDYVKVGGRPYSRAPLDAGWILERFPYTASP
jgi:hypothetical protein